MNTHANEIIRALHHLTSIGATDTYYWQILDVLSCKKSPDDCHFTFPDGSVIATNSDGMTEVPQ